MKKIKCVIANFGIVMLTLTALLLAGCSMNGAGHAGSGSPSSSGSISSNDVALETVQALGNSTARSVILEELAESKKEITLASLTEKMVARGVDTDVVAAFSSIVKTTDLANSAADCTEVVIPELWLFEPQGAYSMEDLLVSFPPSGNEQEWSKVKAYTLSGDVVYLDKEETPAVPVVVVDTYGRHAFIEELKRMNKMLREAGLQPSGVMAAKAAGSYQSSKLTKIRLKDDKEPWILGSAEIYAIISGIHPTKSKPQIYIVDMPYLDKNKRTYYPNQIMIHWDDLAYNVSNILIYEKDSGKNYKDMTKNLIKIVGNAVALFGKKYQVAAKVAEIANAVIDAMPDNWFTNDDDYVDSFYTLEKGKNYKDYYGAAGNAKIDLVDYWYYDNK